VPHNAFSPAPRPLRVLHAIGSISVARGGPSVALYNTITALQRVGIESEIVTTDDDGATRRLAGIELGRPQTHRGVVTHFFPRQTQFYAASLPMAAWLRQHARDYDVVHAHALFNFAPGAAAAAAAFARVPYVIRPAGVLEHWGRDRRRPWLKRGSMQVIEGPLLRRAAAVQFTSQAELTQAQGLPLPARQLVIPLAIVLEPPAPHDDFDASEWRDFTQGRPWALYLSRLDPKKGLERLLAAFAQVRSSAPAARLVIAGDGEPGYVQGLRAQASTLGLDEAVRWVGFVDGARKRWLLEQCSAFVLSSSSENFGVAVVEAMACARPVVVTAGVAIAELVARRDTGIVTAPEPAAIAAALVATFADPALAAARGARGRAAVEEELSLDVHGRRLAALYADITTGRAA
jgi:glycosyltransferase involved in cell wall biosynthesis